MRQIKQDSMYCVTEDGKVFSKFNERFLKLSLSKGTGYIVVNVRVDGERQPVYVHRLVAEAFIPNPQNLPEVNHKDGNKQNNPVDNLEWVTGQQNKDHAKETGLTKRGSQLEKSKLVEEDVHGICEMLQMGISTGEIIKTVSFIVSRFQLLNIRSRRDWTHVSEKYTWKSHSNRRNNKAKCND